jgi:hypothetical protein
MNVALWIAAGLLAAVSLASGAMKLVVARSRLAGHMAWVPHFSDTSVRAIGALEVLAATGLILPGALRVAPVLVPLAATGVVVLQVGAAITNVRYDEVNRIPINVVLIALAVFVAWGRFGPYPL